MAGVVLISPSGEKEYVFDDEIASKQAAGYSAPDDGTQATIRSASGSESTISAADAVNQVAGPGTRFAGGAEQAGAFADYRSEQDYGGFGGGVAAFGLGVARGATFGLSDLLVDDETAQGYIRENEGLSLLGNVGGAIVTGGVTGLTAGAAKLGAALAPGSRAAAAMIAGGAEGMAFGAGQATSSLIIKNEPLTAESVFSEYGTDIFLGGIAGGLGGAVGHGLERAGGKLIGRSEGKLSKLADDVDPERALAANSDMPTAVPLDSAKGKVLTQDFVGGLKNATGIADELVAKARSGGAVEVPSETFVRSFRLSRQWLDDNLQHAVTQAESGALSPEMTAFVKKFMTKARRLYKELGEEIDALGRPEVAQRGGNAGIKALDEDARRALAKKLVDYRNLARELDQTVGGPGLGVAEPAEEVLALERFAANKSSAQFAPEAKQFAAGYESAKKDLFDSLMVRDGVPKKRQLEVFAEMSVDEAAKVAKAYSAMTQNADQLAKVMGSDFAVQASQLADELSKVKNAIGGITSTAPGAPAFKVQEALMALGITQAVIPDMDGPADEILSLWLAAKVGKMGSVGTAAAKGGTNWAEKILHSGARGGSYRAASKAAGGGIKGAFAGAIGSSMGGKLVDGILGNTAGLAKATSKSVARMEGVVGKMVQSAGKVARKAAPFAPKAFLESMKFADIEHPKGTSAFEARAAEIRANVANSYGVQKTVLRNLGQLAMTHPGVTDKTIYQADRVMKFLGTKLPRDPGTVMRLGKSGWKASDQDIAKFARYARAALDPDGELDRFAELDLSPEGAEALRVLYPAKFSKFQEYIAANLPALQDKLSFPEQVQMSVLFQVPVNSMMEPRNVKASQATHAADATASPVSQPPPGSGQTQLSPAQQLLSR